MAVPSSSSERSRKLLVEGAAAKNQFMDTVENDLIMREHDILANTATQKRYVIQDLLGQGTFGQVVRCNCLETGQEVAVKVIKNQTAYFNQAVIEVHILKLLNQNYDPNDESHLVRMLDFFVHCNHLCIVFERLHDNLFEVIKVNGYQGFGQSLVKEISRQVLEAMCVLRQASIIHCDLKPENILLVNPESIEIKVIDFGSACFEKKTVYSYIQSRFYRSPEVLLGHPYNGRVDVWSLGCVAAELYLGLPLFPGASDYDMMKRIAEFVGPPPDHFLTRCKLADKLFIAASPDGSTADEPASAFRLRTEDEYETKTGARPQIGKQYFRHLGNLDPTKPIRLNDIILHYPMSSLLSYEEEALEKAKRYSFVDFLEGVLVPDPNERWTPWQALQHPFITGRPFTGPYSPPQEPTEAGPAAPTPVNIPRNPYSASGRTASHSQAPESLASHPYMSNYLAASVDGSHYGSQAMMNTWSLPYSQTGAVPYLNQNSAPFVHCSMDLGTTPTAMPMHYGSSSAMHQMTLALHRQSSENVAGLYTYNHSHWQGNAITSTPPGGAMYFIPPSDQANTQYGSADPIHSYASMPNHPRHTNNQTTHHTHRTQSRETLTGMWGNSLHSPSSIVDSNQPGTRFEAGVWDTFGPNSLPSTSICQGAYTAATQNTRSRQVSRLNSCAVETAAGESPDLNEWDPFFRDGVSESEIQQHATFDVSAQAMFSAPMHPLEGVIQCPVNMRYVNGVWHEDGDVEVDPGNVQRFVGGNSAFLASLHRLSVPGSSRHADDDKHTMLPGDGKVVDTSSRHTVDPHQSCPDAHHMTQYPTDRPDDAVVDHIVQLMGSSGPAADLKTSWPHASHTTFDTAQPGHHHSVSSGIQEIKFGYVDAGNKSGAASEARPERAPWDSSDLANNGIHQ